LLLDQQGNFLAFGGNARDDYYEHDESGMLFEKFKMRLNDDHRFSEPIAFALNGKTAPLLKVITHSLKYVKDDVMAEINRFQVPAGARAHLFKFIYFETYVQAHTFQTKSHKRTHSKQNLILSGCSGQKAEPF
jgi:hypothetical protein